MLGFSALWVQAQWLFALGASPYDEEELWKMKRKRMVETQLAARGVRNPRVLEAMGKVPRERFVPLNLKGQAY
ncbi:MAG: hypothetical protein NC930_03620, partial [Candidatus Omnitrophica bacterium]|nr:hypothetical protein [Candidatus Omnitrophota bacterium]